jgi:hypothetical protein
MNSKKAFEHCRDNKKRVPEYEPIIARSAKYSYLYARFVVQGRFELGEKKIFKNIEYCCRYATTVIKGRLPEEGHNRMIALAMVEQSMWTKMYFLGIDVFEKKKDEIFQQQLEYVVSIKNTVTQELLFTFLEQMI